jgi:hypothetical protein
VHERCRDGPDQQGVLDQERPAEQQRLAEDRDDQRRLRTR